MKGGSVHAFLGVCLLGLSLLTTLAQAQTAATTPAFVAGGPSYALQFDGVKGQYVSLSAVHNMTTFTAEIHFRITNANVDDAVLVGKGSWRLYRCGNTNNICFYTKGLNPSVMQSNINVNDGKWHHVAVTLAPVSQGSLAYRKEMYIDGKFEQSNTFNGPYQVTKTPYQIGDDFVSTGTLSRTWHGQLDAFREWRTVRNSTEIADTYNSLSMTRTDLVLEMNFDEGSGASTVSQDKTQTAAVAGNPSWVPSEAAIRGGVVVIEVPAQQLTTFSLLAPGAFTASLTSLPTSGSLYQIKPDGTQGALITDPTAFVEDAEGRVMYKSVGLTGVFKFNYILEDRTNTFVAPGTVSVTVNPNIAPVASPALYAARFAGSSTYLSVSNRDGTFDASSMTVEAWVRPTASQTSTGKRYCIWSTLEGGSARIAFFLRGDYNAVIVHLSGQEYVHQLASTVSVGGWVHLALSIAKSTVSCAAGGVSEYRVIVDGEEIGTGPTAPLASAKAYTPTFDKEFRIGQSGTLNPVTASQDDGFVGDMDEFRVWSEVLGFRTIEANRFSTKVIDMTVRDASDPLDGKRVSLLGYWDFDEGPRPRFSKLAFDIGSGQHRTATIVGASRTASSVDFNRITVTADTSLTFSLSGTDIDSPAGLQAATVVTVPALGTLTLEGVAGNGTLRLLANATGRVVTAGTTFDPNTQRIIYFPPNNQNKGGRPFATFSYTVSDGLLTSELAPVAIDVRCQGGAFPAAGTNECTTCPAGTSSQVVSSSVCEPCAVGSFSATNGSATCTLCDPGFVQPLRGQTGCTICANGTSTNGLAGQSRCTTCAPGYFAATDGTGACSLCPINAYQPAAGAASCIECPYGTQSKFKNVVPATDLSHCVCAPGFYRTNSSVGAPCVDCPGGGTCGGEDATPLASRGYWTEPSLVNVFYECPSRDACLGDGSGRCKEHHVGAQCAFCESGYYRSHYACYECAPAYGFWFFIQLVTYFASLYAIYAVAAKPMTAEMSAVAGIGSTIGIFVTYLQITSLFARIDVGWPLWIRDYISHLGVFTITLESLGLDCLSGTVSPLTAWVLRLLSPFIVIATYIVGYGLGKVHEAFVRKVGPGFEDKHPGLCEPPPPHASFGRRVKYSIGSFFTVSIPAEMTDYVNTMHMFLSFAYLYLVETTFEAFACQEQENGDWTWLPDPSMQCWDGGTWMYVFVAALVGVVAYVIGIPLVWFLAARSRHHKGEDALYVKRVARAGAVLWLPFKRDYSWWILIRCLRKFGVPFFIVTFATHSSVLMQLLITALMLFTAVSAQAIYRPYKLNVNNHAEFILGACNVIMCFLAFIYAAGDAVTTTRSFDVLTDIISGVILFGPPAIMGLYFIYHMYKQVQNDTLIDAQQNDIAVRVMCHTFKQVSNRPDAIKYVQQKTSDDDRSALSRIQLMLDGLIGHTQQKNMDLDMHGTDDESIELVEARGGQLGKKSSGRGRRGKKENKKLPPLLERQGSSRDDQGNQQDTPLPGIRSSSMNNIVP